MKRAAASRKRSRQLTQENPQNIESKNQRGLHCAYKPVIEAAAMRPAMG
jgi:hypothetical protein